MAEPRVLLLSPLLDGTGYAEAGVGYAMSLLAAGVDTVCRPLKFNGHSPGPGEIPPEFKASLSRPLEGFRPTHVIQHCLPRQMTALSGGWTNVALFASETSDFRHSGWGRRLNLMDSAWCINRGMVGACRSSGVRVPLGVAPHAVDTSLLSRSWAPYVPLVRHKEKGDFLFYWVGEHNNRKCLQAVVRAYHAEFAPSEPVRLVIKAHRPGEPAEQTHAVLRQQLSSLKGKLGLYRKESAYREELLITHRLTAAQMMGLHQACDVNVTASRGEAWGLPSFMAMAMGRTPICPDAGGFEDWLTPDSGWLVPTREDSPIEGLPEEGLYVASESWGACDMGALRRAMREAYADEGLRKRKARNGATRAHDFSHERVGAILRGLLHGQEARIP